MKKIFTRRDFLRNSAAHTAYISIGTSGYYCFDKLSETETVKCRNCSTVNKLPLFPISSLFSKNKSNYCHNCGINIRSLAFDVDMKALSQFKVKVGKLGYWRNKDQYIPFPNHSNLVNPKKPNLQLSKLQF